MMIKLNPDEGIILETEEVEWVNSEDGYSLEELVLTNKNFYVVCKHKEKKLFAKPTIKAFVNALSEIKYIDGRYLIDIINVDDDEDEEDEEEDDDVNLRIQFMNMHFLFLFERKEAKKWCNAILKILERQ